MGDDPTFGEEAIRRKLAEASVEVLYDILAHPDEHVPAALAAARDALRSRNLSPEAPPVPEAPASPNTTVEDANEADRAESTPPWLVTPVAVGIETKDGTFMPVITRNTPAPVRQTVMLTTVAENQTRVEVHVLQGESARAADNQSLATFELRGIRPAPRGTMQIQIAFEIDVSGNLHVSATDLATGHIAGQVIPSGQLHRTWKEGEIPSSGDASAAPCQPRESTVSGTDREKLLRDTLLALFHGAKEQSHAPDEESPLLTEEEYIAKVLSEEERQQPEKVSAAQRIYRLATAEKLILALKGSLEERAILIRDPNHQVAMAAGKNVSDEVLRGIGNHWEWTKRYEVINSMVRNPRTPIGLALNLVLRLGPRDIKSLAVDPSVPDAIRLKAREYLRSGDESG
jgi:molecular chaperone DnaK (HSP70)